MKQIIQTDKAPAPIGPYSQAVLSSNTLYISGQIALDPSSGALVQESLEDETRQVMQNLSAILGAAGFSFADVVKSTIFLSDMSFFPRVNDLYGSFFEGDFPARETVQAAGLPKGVNVEISMIAIRS
jgi:2-iminobutanoate/2-iminopropanoate deaminase